MVRFGEQRLVRTGTSRAERLLYRLMGVAHPGLYLRSLYLQRELARWRSPDPARILDAGCGAGDYSFYLARKYPRSEVVGVDINDVRIQQNGEMARRLGISNVRFERVDLTAADFSAQFELVISIDVLEHIPRQQEVLARLSQALSLGGIAFFHMPTVRERPVPLSSWLSSFHAWAEKEHTAEDRTAEGFLRMVRASGLEIVRAYRTFGYFTGELAHSLFVLPYERTTLNRMVLGLLALPCRALALADTLNIERTRYAIAVVARKAVACWKEG